MNVGQLRKLLEGLPDQTQVLVPAFDHSYYVGEAYKATARLKNGVHWEEDHGDEYGGVKYDVLIVG